jgi:IS30 family transposase
MTNYREYAKEKLKEGWPPEQIAGRLKENKISKCPT